MYCSGEGDCSLSEIFDEDCGIKASPVEEDLNVVLLHFKKNYLTILLHRGLGFFPYCRIQTGRE